GGEGRSRGEVCGPARGGAPELVCDAAAAPTESEDAGRGTTTADGRQVRQASARGRPDQAPARSAFRDQPPCPSRFPVRYSWPWRKSLTMSGMISLARWSSWASVRLAIGCDRARNL